MTYFKGSVETLKILHVTAHLGGGVGRALSSISTYERKRNPMHVHKILLLDDPEKYQHIETCRKGDVEVLLRKDEYDLDQELARTDIVVVHWWHHPVMALLFANFPNLPIRLIVWVHVNGCNYPCLPFEFAAMPHRTFLTSLFSLENPHWSEQQREEVKKNSAVVYGLGKIETESRTTKLQSKAFVIGYVGTLSRSKLHPKFMDFCLAVLAKVPNAYFVMVGDVGLDNQLLQMAKTHNVENRFRFTGFSNQIINELSGFDVFGYPLNPKHFGATENVLLEAMAFGLPVVALNQNVEKHIIGIDRQVGLLADDIETYADCIKYLHDNPNERVRIGTNARQYVEENFTFTDNVELMRHELNEVMKMSRKNFDFRTVFGSQPHEWFLTCLGDDLAPFAASLSSLPDSLEEETIKNMIRSSSPILRENTKSSILHFANNFPEDKYLQYWKDLITN